MSSFENMSTCAPQAPSNLAACGIPVTVLEDLSLKHLHLQGIATQEQLADRLGLPHKIAEELLEGMSCSGLVDLDSSTRRAINTARGRQRACDAFSVSRYLGPAPVGQTQYLEQCSLQRWDGAGVSEEDLQRVLHGVCLSDNTIQELLLSIARGGSMLLTGRSGNGKTLLANRLGQLFEQSSECVYVPYSLWLPDGILRLFDPTVHHPFDDAPAPESDRRWRRIRRPVIRTSWELKRSDFDIASSDSAPWKAPFQILANGGLIIVDDLGRQSTPLVDILNRWLPILEHASDAVQLPSGRRLTLPVDAWVIFAAGEDAPSLPAPVLRRIRSQVHLPDPDRERFATLLLESGRRARMEVDESAVEELFTHCYSPHNPPKCSDPENLLQTVESICRIHKETVRARADLLLTAARRLGLDGERRAA